MEWLFNYKNYSGNYSPRCWWYWIHSRTVVRRKWLYFRMNLLGANFHTMWSQKEIKKGKKEKCVLFSVTFETILLIPDLCLSCVIDVIMSQNKSIVFFFYYSAPRKKDKLCLVKKPFAIKCKNALILIFYNKIHDIFINTLSSIYNWTTAESLDWNK